MNSKTYVFFGNVGAGKGTQVLFLKELLEKQGSHVVTISPGAEFRKMTSVESFSSVLIKNLLGTGVLFPGFMVSYAVTNVLLRELKSEKDNVIFDGFPRSISQVEILEGIMNFFNRKDLEVIYIEISKEEAVKRLRLRERHDDTDTGIKKRFEEYENNVIPALNLLKEKGCVIHTINGEQHIDEVKKDIFKALGL